MNENSFEAAFTGGTTASPITGPITQNAPITRDAPITGPITQAEPITQ